MMRSATAQAAAGPPGAAAGGISIARPAGVITQGALWKAVLQAGCVICLAYQLDNALHVLLEAASHASCLGMFSDTCFAYLAIRVVAALSFGASNSSRLLDRLLLHPSWCRVGASPCGSPQMSSSQRAAQSATTQQANVAVVCL